jgi:hypothetical protein
LSSKSRFLHVFGNTRNQNCVVVSVPAGFRAYTTGTVLAGTSHGNANTEKRSVVLPGFGQLRNV